MSDKQIVLAPGDIHRTTHGPVSTTQLVQYAGASGDFSRLHFDYPFVREAGWEGVLVHGMLTMAFASTCLAEHAGEQGAVTELSARFLAPVLAGDTVAVESKVMQRDGDVVQIELVANVGPKVVLKGSASVVIDPVAAQA